MQVELYLKHYQRENHSFYSDVQTCLAELDN